VKRDKKHREEEEEEEEEANERERERGKRREFLHLFFCVCASRVFSSLLSRFYRTRFPPLGS